MIIAFVLGTAFGATAVLLWCACALNNKTRKKMMMKIVASETM